MKGTLTFHLPLERGPEIPPEMTLVVRRVMNRRWHAGLSVCSRGDQFVKSLGRRTAYHRLLGRPCMADDAGDLIYQLHTHLTRLNDNRPETISEATLQDLERLAAPLSKMRVE